MPDPNLAKRLDRVVLRLRPLEAERDELIVEARQAGASLREISAHASMTHAGVQKLIGGHDDPDDLRGAEREFPDGS